ncbi:MAG TPA: response regulator [Hyphomicrobiaceae bacterium]|nr:response regulator [Hyphomicrobiaceae bacterium]
MPTCLIVDDIELIRRVLRHMLTSLGFEVREADSADAALELCDHAMPDLVLLDWQMPGLSAHEFVLALRARRHGSFPRIIYCTTNADVVAIARMMASGCNDFLLKPFDRRDLVGRLEAHNLAVPADADTGRSGALVTVRS